VAAVLFVTAEATVSEQIVGHFGETKRFVKFPIGQKPRIGGNLASQKIQLQATVETEPQIVVLAVTHWVLLSHWHETRQTPCFQRVGANFMPKSGNSSGKCGLRREHHFHHVLILQKGASSGEFVGAFWGMLAVCGHFLRRFRDFSQ